jgi:hypothetical protein
MSVMGPGLTGAQVAAFRQVPVGVGEWLGTPCATANNAAVIADTLYVTPWIAPQSCNLDRIQTRVTSGAAGNAKMGIYDAAGNLPGSLLAESTADLSTAATGFLIGTIPATPVVAGRLYWIGQCHSGIPQMQCFNAGTTQGSGYFWPVGSLRNSGDLWTSGGGVYVSRALTYVAGAPFFPSTFGAPVLTTANGIIFAMRRG